MRRYEKNRRGEDITGEMTWGTKFERERPAARGGREKPGVTLTLSYEEADMLIMLMRGMLLTEDRDERVARVLEKLKGLR